MPSLHIVAKSALKIKYMSPKSSPQMFVSSGFNSYNIFIYTTFSYKSASVSVEFIQ